MENVQRPSRNGEYTQVSGNGIYPNVYLDKDMVCSMLRYIAACKREIDVTNLSEHISTMLQSYLVDDNGLCVVKENPTMTTNIRIGAVDLDVEGS